MAEKDLHHKLTADASSLESGMRRGSRAMSDAEREARRLERQQQKTHAAMDQLGRGMLVAGAAIAAGLALSVKAAIEWESAWAGVLKTVDGTPEQMAALEEEIRSLTAVLPATHTEIAAVAEAAGQLGVQRENVAGFTRVMIDMGEATNLSATDAATALARFMNIMQTAPANVDRLGSSIVDLGNNSATTEAEIVAMALRIAGAGNAIGLTEAEVLAFSATLSSVGIEAEAGGTAISRAFLTIDKAVRGGGEELAAFAKVAGMSADQFAAAYRTKPAAAIDAFVQGLGRIQASGGDVTATLEQLGLSEIRVSDALRRLSGSGDLLTRSLETSGQAWDENTALMEEAERRYQTTEAQMAIARNQVNDFAIDIGQTFLPVVGEMADRLGSVASTLGELPGPLKTTVAIVAALAAGVLLLGGGLLVTIPRIAATKAGLDQLAASGGRAAAAVGVLRGATSSMAGILAGPWGLALAAGAVVLGAWANQQAQAKQRAEEVIATLDEQTGAITDNTRAWITNELESRGVLRAAETLGIETRDLVAAIEGEEVALQRVQARMDEFAQTTGAAAVVLETENGQVTISQELMAELAAEIERAQAQQERMQGATEGTTTAMSELDPATQQLAESLGVAAGEAENLSEQVDELDQRIEALLDSSFGLTQAEDALTESMRELVEQVEAQIEAGDRGATSLSGNTEAAISNRRALEDLIEKYAAVIVEMVETGATSEDVAAKTDDFRRELVDVAKQLGVDQDELGVYLALLDDIPSLVATDVNVDTAAAQRKIESLNRAISAMIANANQGIHVRATGGIMQANQHGGEIFGPPGIDKVDSKLTAGEIVIRRSVAQQNKAALLALNATGRWPVTAPATVRLAGGDGAAMLGSRAPVTVNLTAYSDRFSLKQVQDDLAFQGAV